MPAAVMPIWRPQFFDNNGDPLASGTIETYESGTSTPLATYSDSDLSVSNGTTITLNSAGFPQVSGSEVAIFLLPRAYRFVLKNSAGTMVRTVDNVYAVQAAASTNLDISDAVFGENVSAADLLYLSDGSGSRTNGRWYRADADTFAYSLHVVLGFATAAGTTGATGTVRIGGVLTGMSGLSAGSTYYVSGTAGGVTVTAPTNARPVGQAISATVLRIDFSPMWLDPVPFVCNGRLTLTSGIAVTTSDVTAATTLYFTPYRGNRVTLFDGNRWKEYAFTELSIAVPATTSQLYGVFLYDNAGTLTLELTAWTNDTTPGSAALTLQNGMEVKSGATTRLYLGLMRTTAVSGQTEDSLTKRYVQNHHNPRPRLLRRLETTGTWTYTTATIRQANGAAANQVEVVVGVAGARLRLALQVASRNTNADIVRSAGIGEDSTTGYMAAELNTGIHDGGGTIAAGAVISHIIALTHYPAIGRHVYSWNEGSTATGTTTWIGTVAPTTGMNASQAGLSGEIEG